MNLLEQNYQQRVDNASQMVFEVIYQQSQIMSFDLRNVH